MAVPPQYKWFFETTTPVEGHMHAIARTIATRQTKFQFMEIFETHSYGKVLVLDNERTMQGDIERISGKPNGAIRPLGRHSACPGPLTAAIPDRLSRPTIMFCS